MIPVKETMGKFEYFMATHTFLVCVVSPLVIIFFGSLITKPLFTLGAIATLMIALAFEL